MTPEQIYNACNKIADAVKKDSSDPEVAGVVVLGSTLLANFLVNQQRIANALEVMSKPIITCDNGGTGQ